MNGSRLGSSARRRRCCAVFLALALLPGFAPGLLGSGCPHHAAMTASEKGSHAPHGSWGEDGPSTFATQGAGEHDGSIHEAVHPDPAPMAPGAVQGAQHPSDSTHEAPCQCLGNCVLGGAPSLVVAAGAVAPADPVTSPEGRRVRYTEAVPTTAPPFLRPWVRGPPTSRL